MLPAIRRSPIAPTLADRLLGVKLLQPMLRRLAVLVAVVVLAPLLSLWLRLVF